jgi:putative tryptophan/tyrosine transport system substrate-binding protein
MFDKRRRDFIKLVGGAVVGWPVPARAQQAAMPVIGFLRAGEPPKTFVEAFQQGLRERGYVDGQNVVVKLLFTDGSVDELPRLAEELVRSKVDVILASAAPPAMAAKKATTSVPIVFASVIHPVEIGLVPSLGRPLGNVTGVALNPADLVGKRLELLRELVPTLRQVAVLRDQVNPTNPVQLEGTEVAARTLGMQLEPVSGRGPNDFDAAFKAVRGADGLLVLESSLFTTYRVRLVGLAAASRLPAIYGYREMVDAGGLISYGANIPDMYRRAATYVAKILKGAKPADLAVEQPTTLDLVINLRTAKALGLSVPPSVLARADEVIE